MEILLVGAGGALGSLTRYELGKRISQKSGSAYPLGTFIINVSGALLLGVLCALPLHSNMSLLLADGFLGAYTTFSAFMFESYEMTRKNKKMHAFIYIGCTLAAGLAGFGAGFALGRIIAG